MTLEAFLVKLRSTPAAVEFNDTMAIIEANYTYTPTSFRNGDLHNAADQNQGSCKLLAFAQMNQLSESETLACFGAFYRDDVLQQPQGTDHQNIRNFMQTGWQGVAFDGPALTPQP